MAQRRASKISGEVRAQKKRLLFFDIIRILCVAVIIYDHTQYDLIQGFNKFFFSDGYGPFYIFTSGLQGYAVYGMIFVSGAVLEYNYQSISRVSEYLQFIFKRFIRLYPAFWMSLILGIILVPALFFGNPLGVLFEFTGFYIVLGKGSGIVNSMGWFIATIFCLYLLYPALTNIVRKYHLWALAVMCIISWGLRSLVLSNNLIPMDLFWRWFPLFNVFEFCLGIYIVQRTWYPVKENTYPIIRRLADLSFYAFLFHVIVIRVFFPQPADILQPLIAFDHAIALNNLAIGYTLYYVQMLAAIIIISWIVMILDNRIQHWIMRQERVKRFMS